MRRTPRRFARSERASISILTAMLAVVIIGVTGLAVDTASSFYWRGRLRGATETAALAASFDPARAASIAGESLAANGFPSSALEALTLGTYIDDPTLSPAARFQTGGTATAVRIETHFEAPLFSFGFSSTRSRGP